MNGKSRWVLVLLLIPLIALGAVWAALIWFRVPVEVAPVERGRAVSAVPGVVEVSARHRFEIRSEYGGRVVSGTLEPGQRVAAGEVLFVLDTSDLDAEIDRVRRDLETEEALRELGSPLRHDLSEAEEELERMQVLREEGRYSTLEIQQGARRVARLREQIERERIRDQARMEELREELLSLERQRGRMTLRAPVEGDLIDILAYPGDLVAPRAPLARLMAAERRVEATVSEADFAGVEVGQAATVRFLGYGPRLFAARVSARLPAADPETQRYTVLLEIDADDDLLIPGLSGEVSILVGEREDALVIPRRALFGNRVYVVSDGRIREREGEPGFISLTRAEILSGVEAGELVVVENLDRLREGDRVRVLNDVP